jgi:integrase
MAAAASNFSGQVPGNNRGKSRYRGRRGNNEGMIRLRKDGRWEARVSVPGEKRKCFYGHRREDVARQVSVALRDLQKGIGPIRDERLTVSRFLQDWIARLDVRTNSYFYDEQMVRLHIVPRLGRIPLARLSPAHVRKCLDDLLESELSSTTVRHVYDVLHTALEYAVKSELVQRNVADAVKPPRRAEHEMQVLTSDQA